MIVLKSARELKLMREAGRVVAQAHELVREVLHPGVTTQELDTLIADFIRSKGGIPSFLGYLGFPANTCISINEELVHGIPGPRRLEEGDIVSIDIGVILNGYHGDSGWSYGVGEISEEKKRLFDVTEQALWAGIEQARTGKRLSDISRAIQRTVEDASFHVVREYVGHGIGRQMHEEPQLPNYWEPGTSPGPRLRPGMTLAIEPMVQAGTVETEVLDDNWTVISADRSPTAHFEHTVAITPDGPMILTLP
ncbi:MAG: type I methionyl aminopeptidase [Chloroflexota bacterium]|nr:type I methionyl aminopeptidase [Chloroflexota bacterium]